MIHLSIFWEIGTSISRRWTDNIKEPDLLDQVHWNISNISVRSSLSYWIFLRNEWQGLFHLSCLGQMMKTFAAVVMLLCLCGDFGTSFPCLWKFWSSVRPNYRTPLASRQWDDDTLLVDSFSPSFPIDWVDTDDGLISLGTNCNVLGHDIQTIPSLESECGLLCLQNLACNQFRWSRGVCYLIHGYQLSPIPAVDSICGYVKARIP